MEARLIFLAFVVIFAFVGYIIFLGEDTKRARAQREREHQEFLAQPKTIEQLDQEAAWLRAESRRIEAEVEHKAQLALLHDAENFLNNKSSAR